MDLVDKARERASEAARAQAGAVTQLDTVEYELAEIVRELEAAGIASARTTQQGATSTPVSETSADLTVAPEIAARRRAAG
jgi:hypothetical protein